MPLETYQYGDFEMGVGHFELPPVLIGTIFYDGETILERDNPVNFSEGKAKKRIDNHFKLSLKYKIPGLVELSAPDPESMKKYLDFYLDNYEPPFVLGGTFEARKAGIIHLKERGIKSNQYIYNTISNLKNKKELDLLKNNNIETVVILILGSESMTSTQRYNYLVKKREPYNVNLIEGIRQLGVDKIWIDGGVINLESLAYILETQQLISESLQLPVGTAPNLFLFQYSSPRLNKKFHTKYRRASIMFIATWYSNFIFYGAIEDATECFASAYQALEFRKILKEKNIKLLE
ncbi:MAG: Tetrahydromethanopterin S-methyltransferase subunit H [Promethearchaeota archaeon]|nr:MAG: Tetrahydromethanopterin S-methyltransferase subunit H [Candidatus Lokiarchaeota archaeon]